MKKHYSIIFSLLLLLCPLSSIAQNKINASGRFVLRNYQISKEKSRAGGISEIEPKAVKTLVTLADGYESDNLDTSLVEIVDELGDVVIANIRLADMEKVAALDAVKRIEFGEKLQPCINFAREASDVNELLSGISYNGSNVVVDGTGVIAGLMDVGIDPNHANFINAEGDLRVKRVWVLSGENAGSYTSPEAISGFTTDNNEETHGTHVAGIMAGSYNGTGTFASQDNGGSLDGLTLNKSGNMPYFGVATNSDIAMAAGELSTDNILQGVKSILDYAESEGKPAVINLSLGSTTGPHDGTDTYSRKLGELGERGIIVLAAGNDGDVNMHISKKLTASSNSLKTFIAGNSVSKGIADIWSDTSEPLSVSWVIYDRTTKEITTLLKCDVNTDNQYIDIIGTNSGYTQNANFNTAFEGYIALASEVNPNNNRYHVSAPVQLAPLPGNTTKLMGLVIEGATGTKINVYGNSYTAFDNNRISGWSKGSPSESINDAAAAENVITVGSYNTRTCWGVLKENYGVASNGQTLGEISSFSSYGTVNGQPKPDICAPGAGIISSYSTPYTIAQNINTENKYTASTTSWDRNSYWGQMQGTSMACPLVSGIVALMLQVDPTLDFATVKKYLTENATKDVNVITSTTPIRWGAGKANASAAVMAVLQNKAAIGEVWADDNQRLIVTDNGNGYEVFVADGGQMTATLYDLQGRPVAHALGADGTATIDCGSLSSGLYILEARSDSFRLTRKVARR